MKKKQKNLTICNNRNNQTHTLFVVIGSVTRDSRGLSTGREVGLLMSLSIGIIPTRKKVNNEITITKVSIPNS